MRFKSLNSLLLVILFTLTASFASASDLDPSNRFPTSPDPVMTPGKLCKNGSRRYAEGIIYCERNVDSSLKRQIIADYDKKLGYEIRTMQRSDFKIDHFIPLSIGGSNDVENLWPQHKSVYEYSDRLESHVANLMNINKIKQAEAIQVIKDCKLNLGRCAELEDYLKSLY